MTCHTSAAAFSHVKERFFGASSFHIFDSDDDVEEVEHLIEVDEPTPTNKRLRCFFAIECALFVSLKAALTYTGSHELPAMMSEVFPIERSHAGLTKLLHGLEAIEQFLRNDQIELSLLGDRNGELGGYKAKMVERTKSVLSNIVRMAKALRPAMDPEKPTPTVEVGELLGRTLAETCPDLSTCLYWIRRMLNVTTENPGGP